MLCALKDFFVRNIPGWMTLMPTLSFPPLTLPAADFVRIVFVATVVVVVAVVVVVVVVDGVVVVLVVVLVASISPSKDSIALASSVKVS